MKNGKWILSAAVIVGSGLTAALAAPQVIHVGVKGMVCSFCAQGIEKKFKAIDAVTKIDVKLGEHKVALSLKEGATLEDSKIESLLKEAGYTVSKIDRK